MDEFELIQKFFARALVSSDVLMGIGDDCAVVEPPPGRQLVMSIDTMVEGVHFPVGADAEKVGVRVFSAALSDLAAMGARPLWFTLALTLPRVDEAWLCGFSDGLLSTAARYECSLIGGDTTRGPLCISVQVHGSVAPGQALRRSGARPDDVIYVTGSLGDAAAALAVIENKMTVSTSTYEFLLKRYYQPQPRLQEGEQIVGLASAAIDLSDGLYGDLTRICEASGVGAVLDVGRLPIADSWKGYTTESQRYEWALAGGEDYQLCFTVPRDKTPLLESWIREKKLQATPIGKITHKLGLKLVKDGRPYDIVGRGFNHFG